MTELATPPPPAAPRMRWWSLLLVASLAFNLAVGGLVAARFIWPDRAERFSGVSYTQLLPRRFIGDLSRERRKELLAVLRAHRGEFRKGRAQLDEAALRLSAALKAEPYDAAAVKSAIDDFARAGNEIVAGGSVASLDLISRLTPEERVTLAQRIAERAQRRK